MCENEHDNGKLHWLNWAQEVQALAQTGLAFSLSHYDTQRYQRLMEIAAEIVEKHSRLHREEVMQTFMVQPGYATVKVDVRGAVIREGKILLVQECSDERWCLPGGWADVGEVPSEMVEREVREESGLIVKAKKIIALFDANRSGRPLDFFHAYKIIFLCEHISGKLRASEETMDVGFFNFDRLPVLSENRTNNKHLKEIQDHLNDPERPVYFD
jgi:ADP-ribose pyrophosphatase YjhB (NUDIX family)